MFEKQRTSKSEDPSSFDEVPAATQETVSPRPSAKGNAVIGSSIKIKGDVSGDENLIIEGVIEGTIAFANNEVIIGQSGRINADVTAKTIKVDGEVNGDISGDEKVVISRTGKVKGNIVAPRVTLEDGAKFKGSIDMDPSESATMSSQPSGIRSASSSAEVREALESITPSASSGA